MRARLLGAASLLAALLGGGEALAQWGPWPQPQPAPQPQQPWQPPQGQQPWQPPRPPQQPWQAPPPQQQPWQGPPPQPIGPAADTSRRLEWVYLDARGGFEQLGLRTFSSGNDTFTAGQVGTSASGGSLSAGVGARLLFFTFGLRARLGISSLGKLGRIGGEIGMHLPFGRVEPHFELGAGYAAFLGGPTTASGGDSGLSMRGFTVRASGGVDFYVTPFFSLGGEVGAELVGLTRPAVASAMKTSALASDASALGGAFTLTAGPGLHF